MSQPVPLPSSPDPSRPSPARIFDTRGAVPWIPPSAKDFSPAPPQVKFRKVHPDAVLPRYQTAGAAGMDLVGIESRALRTGQRHLFDTGLEIEIPPGFEGQVRSRSGLASKRGIAVLNSPGTIDCDYRGRVYVLLVNTGLGVESVLAGERIAQLVIAPVAQAEIVLVEELSETDRGAGGFGSTGSGQETPEVGRHGG